MGPERHRTRKASVITTPFRRISDVSPLQAPGSSGPGSLVGVPDLPTTTTTTMTTPTITPTSTSSKQTVNPDVVMNELNYYYGLVKRQLIRFQNPYTGLFPACSKDKDTVGSVKESIYCAMAIWGLHLSYRRLDYDKGRSCELKGHVINCLRGILSCWMKQSKTLEEFKRNQSPKNALHSKFNIVTGDPIYSSEEYGHLQIDCVSLYLLFLTQAISSGMAIIYSMDEINFVQNLIYYVERAYRTPDFGMWERGSKFNNGTPEAHASSIGMAKAALEAVNGFNCYGESGSSRTVLYADIDAHNRNRNIFETLLPCESASKSVDVSLLITLAFPAFATHDEKLYSKTRDKILTRLEGEYGFKRYIRDGYLTDTAIESKAARFYPDGRIQEFEGIEPQWPIFYTFMVIEGIFKNDEDQVEKYQQLLKKRIIYCSEDEYEDPLIPQAYYVPGQTAEWERKNPGSQMMIPTACGSSKHDVFLWGQAMLILTELLTTNLLHIHELDPIRRSLPSGNRPKPGSRRSAFEKGGGVGQVYDSVVQIVMISESIRLKALLATFGIQSQTPDEIEPVQIWPQSEMVKVYQYLGRNEKLNLTGRPPRPIGTLGTSKVYRVNSQTVLCYPLIFSASKFYLSHDMAVLTDDILNELHFVSSRWRLAGRPTMVIVINENHMKDEKFSKTMLSLLSKFREDSVDGVKIRIGRVQNIMETSCVEHLDFLHTIDLSGLNIRPYQQLAQIRADYTGLLASMKRSKPEITEKQKDYVAMYKDQPTHEIINAIQSSNNIYGNIQMLGILLHREGPNFMIDNHSVHERLEKLNHTSGGIRHWAAMRYSASLLKQTIESISPFVTHILVSGKQVMVGAVGREQVLFDKPMTPDMIHEALYTKIQPYNVVDAVMQQEILLYSGKFIVSNPELFAGILKVRAGWILRGLDLYVKMKKKKVPNQAEEPVEACSPSRVRHALWACLAESRDLQMQYGRVAGREHQVEDDFGSPPRSPTKRKPSYAHRPDVKDNLLPLCLTVYEVRAVNGYLMRVPPMFYNEMWLILQRSPQGIYIGTDHLPQEPTLTQMKSTEIGFAHRIEEMLSNLKENEATSDPAYTQITVELFCVMYTILKRNPELYYLEKLSSTTLIKQAMDFFRKDRNIAEDSESEMDFYSSAVSTTSGYLARAIVNNVLKGSILDQVQKGQKISAYDCAVQ